MSKVFFVGMHNKPDKSPLCSTTKSGAVIDKIIKATGCEAVKTNLCDVDYLPDKKEIFQLATNWVYENEPECDDVIVLLGAWVHDNFRYEKVPSACKVIKLPHPASSMYGNVKVAAYVENAISKLKPLTNA